jgi:hypothetical protein
MTRLLILTISSLILVGCASGTGGSYNPTVYPFEIDNELLATTEIKRVVIAPVNLGGATRNYLEDSEADVDKQVRDYLESNGFDVVSQRRFQQEWKTATRIYGNPIDPTSGRVNQKTFTLALVAVRDALVKSDDLDAIVFTDIIEKDIAFNGGLKHLARWDGVTRKPTLQGPGDGVSTDFDWNKNAKGASIWVNVYTVELQRVFSSVGGIDATQAIDTRSATGAYVRRRNVLENKNFIQEGIEIAFHPFIEMGGYPGNE